MLSIYSSERVYIYNFSVTAITGFKRPSMNCYLNPLASTSQRPKCLSGHRRPGAQAGAAARGQRARLGRTALDFAALNTLVTIWVYPAPNTDLTPVLFVLQKGNVPTFQGYVRGRGNKKPSPLVPGTTCWLLLAEPSSCAPRTDTRCIFANVFKLCR